MMDMPFFRPRTSASPSEERSTPSRLIQPDSISTRRKRAAVRVLLPAPVRPTTPHLCPDFRENVSPLSDRGRPGLYLSSTSANSSVPVSGHASGSRTAAASVSSGPSCGSVVISVTLSTDVMAASLSDKACTMKPRLMVKFADHMMSMPAMPGSILRTSLNATTTHTENNTDVAPTSCIRTDIHRWAAIKFIMAALFESREERNTSEKCGPIPKTRIVDDPSIASESWAWTGERDTASRRCRSTADLRYLVRTRRYTSSMNANARICQGRMID
mmetsp:Transcript_23164/g.68383  ORF Transcript_23164/g.68383 Transcript_23164/m.68383 type:complete len:273 (+) Transcript_23164:543-1361(+)